MQLFLSMGNPSAPATPAKARKLIKNGGAIPKRDKLGTFYIQLTTPTGETIPHDTVVGIDPGKRYSGVGVQTPQATLWMGHLVLPFSVVKKAMASRQQFRFAGTARHLSARSGSCIAPGTRFRPALGPTAISNGACCRNSPRFIR